MRNKKKKKKENNPQFLSSSTHARYIKSLHGSKAANCLITFFLRTCSRLAVHPVRHLYLYIHALTATARVYICSARRTSEMTDLPRNSHKQRRMHIHRRWPRINTLWAAHPYNPVTGAARARTSAAAAAVHTAYMAPVYVCALAFRNILGANRAII